MAQYWDLPDDGGIAPAVTSAPEEASVGAFDYSQGYDTPEAVDYAAQAQRAGRQQAAAQRGYRVKAGRVFSQQRIPFADDGRTVRPIADATGAPLTNYDKANDIAYDSAGQPQHLNWWEDGNVSLSDPYHGAPRQVDKGTGDVYLAPKGLPWRGTGEKDEQVVSGLREKVTASAASALSQQASMEAADVRRAAKDLKDRQKALYANIPELEGAPDEPTARKSVDDYFNGEYADPRANLKAGWLNTGDYTDSAKQLRAEIDARKAATHAELDGISQASGTLAQMRQVAEQRGAQARAVQQQVITAKLERARKAGLTIPGLTDQAPTSPMGDAGTAAPVSQPSEPFTADEAPYRIHEDGSVAFDPSRLVTSISAARDAGVIDQDRFNELLPKAQAAEKALSERQQLLSHDTVASKLQAAGYGVGKGAAFLAGAPLGAGIGAEIGTAFGPIGTAVGGALGGLITGSIASWSADKIVRKLGQYSDAVKSFTDAADAHPMYDAAGNLVAFGAGIPKAGMQAVARGIRAVAPAEGVVAKGAEAAAKGYEASGGGVVDTVRNLSEDASIRTAAGASKATVATALASRVGGMAAGNVAIDTIIKEGSKALGLSDEGQTLPGAAQAALIGAFVSGHGITFKNYEPEQIGTILARSREAVARGVDPKTILTAAEYEAGEAAAAEIQRRVNMGDATPDSKISARQALVSGKNYGVTAAKTETPGQEGPSSTGPDRPHTPPQLSGQQKTSPAEQFPRPPSSGSVVPSNSSPPEQSNVTSSYPVVTPPSGGGQQGKDEATTSGPSNTALPGEQESLARQGEVQTPAEAPAAPGSPQPISTPSVVEPGQQTQPASTTEPPVASVEGDPNGKTREEQNTILERSRANVTQQIEGLKSGEYVVTHPDGTETAINVHRGKTGRVSISSKASGETFDLASELGWGRTTEANGNTVWDRSTIRKPEVPGQARGTEPKAAPAEVDAEPREWGDVVPSDDIGATIQTKNGKNGIVVAVTKNVVRFRNAEGKADAAHIKNTRVVSPMGETQPAAPAIEPLARVAKAKRFVVRYTGDTFTEDPIISTIIEHGGLMSKSTAQTKWNKEKWAENKGEWDDAPKLDHPTHNTVYKPGGLQPDEMVTALVEAGHLPESATVADLWAAVNRASIGGASMRKQTAAARAETKLRAQQEKRFSKDVAKKDKGEKAIAVENLHVGDSVRIGGETMKVIGLDPDTFAVTLEDHEKYGVQSVHDGAVIYGKLDRAESSDGSARVFEDSTGDLFATDRTNAGKEATVTNEEGGTLVRMGGQVVARLRQKGGAFTAELNEAGKALAPAQRVQIYKAAQQYSKTWQAAKIREGARRPLAGGEVRSQGDLLDSSYSEDPLFQQPRQLTQSSGAAPAPRRQETGVQRIRRMVGDGARLFETPEENRARVIKAYRELVKKDGFPSVMISELQAAAGVPMPELKEWLRAARDEGSAVLSVGDWSIATPEQHQGVIEMHGRKYLQVRFSETPSKPFPEIKSESKGQQPVDDATIEAYLHRHGITKKGAAEDLRLLVTVKGDESTYSQLGLGLFADAGGGGSGSRQVGGRGTLSDLSAADIAKRREENRAIAKGGAEAKQALRDRGRISSIIHELVQPQATTWDVRGATIAGPGDAFKLLQAIRSPYIESLKIAVLDDAGKVVHSEIATIGGLNESVAHPRDIMRIMQRIHDATGARRLLVGHNHPSGDPSPSDADRTITDRLEAAAEQLGFEIFDHVITNGDRYFSFKEQKVTTIAPEKVEMQPWEVVPRRELITVADPSEIQPIIASLRNADPKAGHIFYMSTRGQLLGIERVESMTTAKHGELTERIGKGAMREGAYGVTIHYPGAMDRAFLDRVVSFSKAMLVRLADVVFDAESSGMGYMSSREMGLIREEPAKQDDGLHVREDAKPTRAKDLTPEEAAFVGPVIPSLPTRLVEGAADTLDRTKGAGDAGSRLRQWRDNLDKFPADGTRADREFQRAMGEDDKRITEAEKQVDKYFEAIEAGDEVGAMTFRNGTMTDDGRAALDAWEKGANAEFQQLQALNYQVKQSDGTSRDIRKVKNFHPRVAKKEYVDAVMNFVKDPEKAREVLKIVLKHFGETARPGETPKMTTEAQAMEYLKAEWTQDADFDLHGSTERARELKLPSQLYDYSYKARTNYLRMSAERRAQVDAFGQAGRLDPENYFNKLIARMTDPKSASWVAAVRDAVYGATKKDTFHKMLAGLNGIATGSHLANPVTIATNLFSGITFTSSDLGAVNSAKALGKMLKDYEGARHEAEDLGILSTDLMSLYQDAERYRSGTIDKIHAATAAALKYTGYNKSEEWVRVHQLLTAKEFVSKALQAQSSGGDTRTSRIYTAFFKRHNVAPAKIYEEKGRGPETEKFYRSVVRDTQGGYRIDQVQPFLETPEGKFLFKYQKWGFQQSRNFKRNVIDPARGKDGPVDVAPLLRYLVMTASLGLGLTAMKRLLFGTPDRTASLEQIGKTWSRSEIAAVAQLAQKLWSAQIAAGAYGAISNYAQMTLDIAERSRVKNPLEPPGISTVTNVGEQFLRLVEQKKLTAKDVDDFLRAQISLYRTGKAAGARLASETGTPVLRTEQARQDQAWLSMQTKRYADEIGVEASRTSLGRIGKTEMSPAKRDVLDALRAGDVPAARAALKDYLDQTPKDQRIAALKSLSATVRSSQPVKVGAAGEARRTLFLEYAKANLTPDDVQRIRRIDQVYRQTAQRIGIFDPKPATANSMASTRSKLNLTPAGRSKVVAGASWWD